MFFSYQRNPRKATISNEIKTRVVELCKDPNLKYRDIQALIKKELGREISLASITSIGRNAGLQRQVTISDELRYRIIELCGIPTLGLWNIINQIKQEFDIALDISTISQICNKAGFLRQLAEVRQRIIELSNHEIPLIQEIIKEEFGMVVEKATIKKLKKHKNLQGAWTAQEPKITNEIRASIEKMCQDPLMTYANIIFRIQKEFDVVVSTSTIGKICRDAGFGIN